MCMGIAYGFRSCVFEQTSILQGAVDGHVSSLHKINSVVSKDWAPAPTLFLFDINDLLLALKNPFHCLADYSRFNSNLSFNKPELNLNMQAVAAALSSRDLETIRDWVVRSSIRSTNMLSIQQGGRESLPNTNDWSGNEL